MNDIDHPQAEDNEVDNKFNKNNGVITQIENRNITKVDAVEVSTDVDGDIGKDDDLYDAVGNTKNLHGYNKISHGCGKIIQLEDPNKKELLVRCLMIGDGFLVVGYLSLDSATLPTLLGVDA